MFNIINVVSTGHFGKSFDSIVTPLVSFLYLITPTILSRILQKWKSVKKGESNFKNSVLLCRNSFTFWAKSGIILIMQAVTEKKFAAGLSITSNSIIIILKLIAGTISGSISIISEAIHSLSDFLASVLTFFAVMKSSEPADKTHPFGHGRYEDMSGFIEGGLIIAAAMYIIFESVKKIFLGFSMETESMIGIFVMAISVIANIVVSSYLFHVAKKTESVSLYADAKHLSTDVWTSFGILLGLVAIKITGIHLLDPIIAIAVACIILKAGFSISKTTLNNLLDGSIPDYELEKIKNIINSTDEKILGYKDLRATSSGAERKIEVTILFREDMVLRDCHAICDKLENNIRKSFANSLISIHAEPKKSLVAKQN